MNEISSAKNLCAETRRHSLARDGKARLHLRQTRSGAWVVRDDADCRGGCFLTLAAALKFISTEFGAGALVITTHVTRKEAA